MAVVINGGSGKKKRKPQTSPDRLPIPVISPLPLPQISPDRLFPGPTGAVASQPRPLRLPDAPIPRTPPTGQLPGIPGLVARFLGGGREANIAQRIEGLFRGSRESTERRITSQLPPVSVTGVGFDPTPAPIITTPQSPFALEEQLFHDISQHVVKQIFQALDTGNRNRLPRQITDVIAALLPWREWGFSSYQEALRELGFTELPGQGIWIRDEEITSPVGPAGQNIGGGQTATQLVIQRAGFGGGGSGGFRSPQFSTLINWRI